MKKFILISVFAFAVVSLFAQSNAPWNVDFNVGGRLFSMNNNATNYNCSALDLGANVGVTYMFYNITDVEVLKSLGLKFDLAYDNVTSNIDGTEAVLVTNLKRASGQIVVDIDNIIGYQMYPFGLVGHIGSGLTLMQRAKPRPERMINGIIGVSPRFWITENMAINMDFSFIILGKQTYGVEMINRFSESKIDKYSNVTLGFTWGIPDYRSKNTSF
ncbi:MAG TPA: hypothetical protein PKN32_11690 [Bacteroidales bacterium]|nr:hypothetical protein [Bacteroidales bacterium]